MTPRGALASPCRRAACYAAWLVAACYQCTAAQGASNPFCPVYMGKGVLAPPPPTCLELVTGASVAAMTDMSKITESITKRIPSGMCGNSCQSCTDTYWKDQPSMRGRRLHKTGKGSTLRGCCDTKNVTVKKRVFVDRLESYFGKDKYDDVKAQIVPLCQEWMADIENNVAICGSTITLPFDKVRYPINCDQKKTGFPSKVDDAGKPYTATDLVAVMDICVTTCMHDPKQTCCGVPTKAAPVFACCREKGCCVDQSTYVGPGSTAVTPTGKITSNITGKITRKPTTRTTMRPKKPTGTRFEATRKPMLQGIRGRRAQVSVSVSVSVTVAVEGNTAAVSVYDALLRCLQNPAKLDAMCLTGSSGH